MQVAATQIFRERHNHKRGFEDARAGDAPSKMMATNNKQAPPDAPATNGSGNAPLLLLASLLLTSPVPTLSLGAFAGDDVGCSATTLIEGTQHAQCLAEGSSYRDARL